MPYSNPFWGLLHRTTKRIRDVGFPAGCSLSHWCSLQKLCTPSKVCMKGIVCMINPYQLSIPCTLQSRSQRIPALAALESAEDLIFTELHGKANAQRLLLHFSWKHCWFRRLTSLTQLAEMFRFCYAVRLRLGSAAWCCADWLWLSLVDLSSVKIKAVLQLHDKFYQSKDVKTSLLQASATKKSFEIKQQKKDAKSAWSCERVGPLTGLAGGHPSRLEPLKIAKHVSNELFLKFLDLL